MTVRLVKGSDYYVISPLINDWWNGRQMSDMLPKLFLIILKILVLLLKKKVKL